MDIVTDQPNSSLAIVIDHLRNSNAAEELMIDDLNEQNKTLATPDTHFFIKEVPAILELIMGGIGSLVSLFQDSLNYERKRDDKADAEKRESEVEKARKDSGKSKVTFGSTLKDTSKNWLGGLLGLSTFFFGAIYGIFESVILSIKASKSWQKLIKGLDFITDAFKFIFAEIGAKISKLIPKRVKDIFVWLAKAFKATFGTITKFFPDLQKFISTFEAVIDYAKAAFKLSGSWLKIGVRFGRVFSALGKMLGWPLTIVLGIVGAVQGFIKGYNKEGILSGIKGALVGAFDMIIGSILNLLKDGVSWVLSKFGFDDAAASLDKFDFTELFSQFVDRFVDSIKHIFALFSKGDILGGVIATISFLIDKTIGDALDLIKNLVSWISGLLGFDNVKKALDSFSFTGMYERIANAVIDTMSSLWDKVTDFIKSIPDEIMAKINTIDFGAIFDNVVNSLKGLIDGSINLVKRIPDLFKKAYDTVTSAFADIKGLGEYFIKKILQQILPRPDKNLAWYDPANLVASAIPKGVYEYAGINPETGKITEIKAPEMNFLPKNTASVLEQGAASALSGGTTIINNITRGGDVNNVSSSNVNNNVNSASGHIITGSAMEFTWN